MPDAPEKIRVDKWLWHARFYKSRSLAGDVARSGRLRVNGDRIEKPAHGVRPGDVLTFPKAGHIRVIRIDALGLRRGPAPEADALYTDLAPPERDKPDPTEPHGEAGGGRPTKKARREIDALRRSGS